MKAFRFPAMISKAKWMIPAMVAAMSPVLSPSQVLAQSASTPKIESIEDYNAQLIDNGVSWSGSAYFPSMYTGFAPREEEANRIHFHLSRGNVARLTVTLDEQAILTYLYSLQKRSDVVSGAIANGDIKPVYHAQNNMHEELLKSPKIAVRETIAAFEGGKITREEFYAKSLEIMKALNPGRIFELNLDLKSIGQKWRSGMLATVTADARKAGVKDASSMASFLSRNSNQTLILANQVLFGRINVTQVSASQIQKIADLAMMSGNDEAFAQKTAALIKDLTGNRFDFKVVRNGKTQPAMNGTQLAVAEFTAIYPVGSVLATTKDSLKNDIPIIREKGALNFYATDRFDVDQIRSEGYYGWIPKMNYTATQNAIHNPAVRTNLNKEDFSWLHTQLNIPQNDKTMWLVSRGPVSHGCTRMAAGHIHEVRAVFPSDPSEMTHVVYTGNSSTDYDLYDVDGSGQLKVMGSDYLVAYFLVSNTDEGYREARGLTKESFHRDEFYRNLYGAGQMTKVQDQFIFNNPSISYFSGTVGRDIRANAVSVKIPGDFPLYEQKYEQDKIQFFDLPKLGIKSLGGTNEPSRLVRLFGRVNACGPFAAEFAKCREAGFAKEMNSVLGK